MLIKLKDLLAVNPEIDRDAVCKHIALYEGGSKLNRIKDELIIKRQIETENEQGGKHYHERKKRAQYINRASGLINWIVATSCKDVPAVKCDSEDEDTKEYYEGLNKDADGAGTPFASLVKQLMTDMLVKNYPYLEVRAEGAVGPDSYRINHIPTEMVLDYDISDNNEIDWIKTHAQIPVRATVYGPADETINIITIYTAEDTIGYAFYGKDKVYKDEMGNVINEETELEPSPFYTVEGHDFGTVPIFRGKATPFHYVMDRISETLKALFNAEIDLSFALATAAYPQFYLKLEDSTRINQVIRSELSALLLLTTEDAGYVTPGVKEFQSLFINIERLKAALLESLRMMSSEVASIPQAGRLSGDAVREMRSPLESIIMSLSYPVTDCIQKALNAIKAARGDDCEVSISNFGDIMVSEDDVKEIEDTYAPQKAKYSVKEVEKEYKDA